MCYDYLPSSFCLDFPTVITVTWNQESNQLFLPEVAVVRVFCPATEKEPKTINEENDMMCLDYLI